MKKILRFLRDSWLTLFCAALLLGATATAWRLLDARFVNDHILFATTNQNAYVYLDDTLVYMHGRWDDPAAARGRAFHYIHLDQNIAGKRLTILLQSAYPGWLGSIDYMRFGSSGDFLRSISFADAIYISSLSVALSLIIFLVMDLTWRGAAERRRRLQLYLIGSLASFILWTTGSSSFFARIYGMSDLWWELHLAMLYIMPLFCIKIAQEIVSPRYAARIKIGMRVFLSVFVLAAGAEIAGMNGFMNALVLYYPLLFIGSLILIHALVRSSWQRHPACRYGVFAVIAIVAFGTIDALHWEYHRLSLMFSTTVFSSIPLIFHVIRAQMMEDAALAQQNEDLARELEISQNEAQRDFLTGAYNRHQLGGGFARFSALAYERGFKFSFAIFDVDHFKIVNDTKGHLAGDQILKQIADTIHEEIDRRHLFIRYGGDEFVLLALHYDLAAMVAFCEHLRGILEQRLDGVTLSFGVSTWHGKKDRLQALIDRADRALYLSKERGRNTVSAENDEGAA